MSTTERASKAERVAKSINSLILLGVLFSAAIGGFGVLGAMHGPYLPAYQADHRFATDNATAATANAVEHVARNYEPPTSAPQWFSLAILCLILREMRLAKSQFQHGPPPLKQ